MRHVRVYTPDPQMMSLELLRKPFVLHLPETKRTSRYFKAIVPIPNVQTMLGIYGGGAAPGFVFTETTWPEEDTEYPQDSREWFIGAHAPGSQFSHTLKGAPTYMGTLASTCILLSYFSFPAPTPEAGRTAVGELAEGGLAVVPLVEHVTPETIKELALHNQTRGGIA